jgi:superfamily II DNA or RNA helicase
MKLRPYQEDAKAAVLRQFCTAKSTLVEMATGLGKTVLFGHIAHEWPGRVLVIAHRDELIRQAAEKIRDITGDTVAIEMGTDRADNELFGTKVTVASIQTLSREKRRNRFHPDHFSLIIVDEGHHATANTYREVMDYFGSAKRLFVTATPKRADQVGLGSICETVAYQFGIESAIDEGWLTPIKQKVVKVEGLDFTRARTVAEDFNQADLELILTEEKPLHSMVSSAFEIVGNRQSLWFCASVLHAKKTAFVLERYCGEGKCAFLSGDTPKDDRRKIIGLYKSGAIQHLLNCSLFLEGFDAPTTSAVIMGRPTKSLGLYTQVLGRGTRTLPNVVDTLDTAEARREAISLSAKPDMLVVDYVGNAGRHKIVQAADVLAGKYPPEVREYAKEIMEEEGEIADLEKTLRRSDAELALLDELRRHQEEAERLAARERKSIVAKASYYESEVSPFENQYQGRQQKTERLIEYATPKQAGYIVRLSRDLARPWAYKDARNLSKSQAQGVIGKLRAEAGAYEN